MWASHFATKYVCGSFVTISILSAAKVTFITTRLLLLSLVLQLLFMVQELPSSPKSLW